MNTLKILLLLIIVFNSIFLVKFIKDLTNKFNEVKNEKANSAILPFTSFAIFLLSSLGISDFAISTLLYPKLKWVDMKKLPGTLNTQCVIPVAVMALSYISSIEVGITTLITCIVAQVIGAYIGPRFVVKLPEKTIKIFIGIGLLIASLIIIANLLNIIPNKGVETELTGIKLIIAAILLFIYGALNNIGIGSYALTMVTIYILGLNIKVAFPIMMGAATFSVPIGSMQFINFGQYSRKITLFTSIFGSLGVIVAAKFIKNIDVSTVNIILVIILIYTSFTMLYSELNKRKEKKEC